MLNWNVEDRTVWSFNYVYLQNVLDLYVKKKEKDLALNSQKWLICNKTQPN